MDDTVGIGDAARALGTTERTLRYYEHKDLIRPSDLAAGGRRRYDHAALDRARRVLSLRRLGLAIADIAATLSGEDETAMSRVLIGQRRRIAARVAELQDLDRHIAAVLAGEESTDELETLAMEIVLTDIYTRTGDDGTTALNGSVRVDKTDPRLDVMGDLDELVSAVGVAVAAAGDDAVAEVLTSVQNDLFDLGADLAATAEPAQPRVGRDYVTRLEDECDRINATLPQPESFVLPGSGAVSAELHHARAICRRAERHSWLLDDVRGEGRQYLNRLSDLLFVVARSTEPQAEPTWAPGQHQPHSR